MVDNLLIEEDLAILEEYFSENQPLTDVALVVEGQEIWVSRIMLSWFSPVFKVMLISSDFKENGENRIPLPDKAVLDIFCLVKCLFPCPNLAEISEENVEKMLQLADEYEISDLNKRCERFLRLQAGSLKYREDKVFKIISLAARYHFDEIVRICVPFGAAFEMKEIELQFSEIPCSVLALFYESKVISSVCQSCFSMRSTRFGEILTRQCNKSCIKCASVVKDFENLCSTRRHAGSGCICFGPSEKLMEKFINSDY